MEKVQKLKLNATRPLVMEIQKEAPEIADRVDLNRGILLCDEHFIFDLTDGKFGLVTFKKWPEDGYNDEPIEVEFRVIRNDSTILALVDSRPHVVWTRCGSGSWPSPLAALFYRRYIAIEHRSMSLN